MSGRVRWSRTTGTLEDGAPADQVVDVADVTARLAG